MSRPDAGILGFPAHLPSLLTQTPKKSPKKLVEIALPLDGTNAHGVGLRDGGAIN